MVVGILVAAGQAKAVQGAEVLLNPAAEWGRSKSPVDGGD